MKEPKFVSVGNKEKEGMYCIVRTENAGVFAGTLESIDDSLRMAIIKNARRIWYWAGAASLSQLAMEGTKKPEECKFPCEVPEVKVYEVIEVIPCTKEAYESIKDVEVWESGA
jgi:hypothetical protein